VTLFVGAAESETLLCLWQKRLLVISDADLQWLPAGRLEELRMCRTESTQSNVCRLTAQHHCYTYVYAAYVQSSARWPH